MRVQPSQRDIASFESAFNVSKDYVCIQPSALELSMNAKMCEPCPSCRIVMYICIYDAGNSKSFSVSFLFRYDGIFHRHANPLPL